MGVVWKQVLTIMHLLFLTALGLFGLAQSNPYEYAVYNYDGSFYYPYGYYPARTSYSYAPAVTHAYGNVDQSVGTPYMYTRLPADIPYGERDRQGYSAYVPAVNSYNAVVNAIATPFMYRRASSPVFYGHQARVGYTPNQPHYIH